MTQKVSPIRMAANEDKSEAEIFIYDPIGEGGFFFDAYGVKDLKQALDAAPDAKKTTLRINSLGGDAYQAIAMHSLLKDSGREITVVVDGIAASAASVIAMAGDIVEMRTGAQIMIHEPWNIAVGTADDLEKTVNQLKATTESAIDIYEAKSGKSRESIAKMMKDETWMSASEAKNEGFADSVSTSTAMSMSVSTEQLALAKKHIRIPEAALSLVKDSPRPQKTKEAVVPDANPKTPETPEKTPVVSMSVAEYEAMKANQKPSMEQSNEDAVKAERHRVSEINAVCQMAGYDAAATKKFIDDGTSLETVQSAALTQMAAKNPPASDGEGGQTADPNMAYRKEYREVVSGGMSMSMTENDYVNVRLVEDGKSAIDFEAAK